jgi:hypothetical protein
MTEITVEAVFEIIPFVVFIRHKKTTRIIRCLVFRINIRCIICGPFSMNYGMV